MIEELKPNIRFCGEYCKIGKEKSKEFLDSNNSAYDAALDFMWFVDKCFINCSHKDKHNK